MDATPEKPIFHVILSDRDEWAVEVEWPDGVLERINTFRDYSSAANWVATQDWLVLLLGCTLCNSLLLAFF